MSLAYFLVALLGAAIAVFAIQNNSAVVIRFLAWRLEGALSLVILLSALLGVVLTAMLGVVRHWKMRSRIRQLENQLARVPAPAPQSITQEPPF
jgi:lipopolysaccharide assembly protein A